MRLQPSLADVVATTAGSYIAESLIHAMHGYTELIPNATANNA